MVLVHSSFAVFSFITASLSTIAGIGFGMKGISVGQTFPSRANQFVFLGVIFQLHNALIGIVACFPVIFGIHAFLGFIVGVASKNALITKLSLISGFLSIGIWLLAMVGGSLINIFPFLENWFSKIFPQFFNK